MTWGLLTPGDCWAAEPKQKLIVRSETARTKRNRMGAPRVSTHRTEEPASGEICDDGADPPIQNWQDVGAYTGRHVAGQYREYCRDVQIGVTGARSLKDVARGQHAAQATKGVGRSQEPTLANRGRGTQIHVFWAAWR